MPGPVLESVKRLGPAIDAASAEGERLRRMPPSVVEALRPTGAFNMLVPTTYGGPGMDPLAFTEVVDEVAYWDGAAGWCVMNSASMSSTSVFLEPGDALEVYGDPNASFAGAAYPSGRAKEVDGGWRLSGQWAWGSGSDHADWMLGGTMVDRTFWMMFFPARDVKLHDNWHSSGLRGTASGDYSVEDIFVPQGRAFAALGSKPHVEVPIAYFPNFTLLATGVAAAMLGIARRAVDELANLAAGKTPAYSSRTLADYPLAQVNISLAEAKVMAARAFLRESVAEAWETLAAGGRVSVEQRAKIRLARAHAASESAAAVDLAYTSGGGSSVHESSPLQRCFRDIHTATQHIQVSDRNLLTYGRLRFGVEADTSMF